jgi:hypothetical protein
MLVEQLRAGYYRKAPGVSETIDWLRALTLLGMDEVGTVQVEETLGCLLKDSEDVRLFLEKDHDRVYRGFGLRSDGPTAGHGR